jgi:ferredoxin
MLFFLKYKCIKNISNNKNLYIRLIMSKKIYIDQDECIGCALCEESLPEVFRINNDGLSEVINQDEFDEREVQDVIDECPVECIHWEE